MPHKNSGSNTTAITPVARLNKTCASAVRLAGTLPPMAASAPVTVVPHRLRKCEQFRLAWRSDWRNALGRVTPHGTGPGWGLPCRVRLTKMKAPILVHVPMRAYGVWNGMKP
jgi:hypothetical protein